MILLLVLHHIADVAFQPSWLIKKKETSWWSVYEHCFIWTGLISGGLFYLGLFSWWKFIFLFIGHFVIDYVRYRWFLNKKYGIYIDQLLHYLQILIVYL